MTQENVNGLSARLRGDLIEPGDARYDDARKVYNGMIDRRPRLIAKCADVADVISCVNFARENEVRLAIRCGGHSAGGLGVVDDGLVIDLSGMKGVRVDPKARTVRVEGGCTWGDVDHVTHAFGMATPSGIISTTGVAGLTLGGGLGHLTRKCGLTIDNLIEADLVLADGSVVTASADENTDLYWAIRGGGGNFGVVTSFVFRLHPIEFVYAGPVLWELEKATEVMRFYREFIVNAPDDVSGFFAFLVVPPAPPFPEHLHLKTMCGIVCCYTGPLDKGEEALRPLTSFGPPAFAFTGPMPHPVLQSLFDPLFVPGMQWYWKADFVNELSDEAIREHVRHGSQTPTMHSTMHLYPINGAAHRVGKNDTAWSFRESNWAAVIVGVDPNPANNDKITAWAKDYWEVLHPYSAGGAYVNFMMDEGEDRIRATYQDNYDRLVKIKTKYDPANLFRVNQNIRPAASRAATRS